MLNLASTGTESAFFFIKLMVRSSGGVSASEPNGSPMDNHNHHNNNNDNDEVIIVRFFSNDLGALTEIPLASL